MSKTSELFDKCVSEIPQDIKLRVDWSFLIADEISRILKEKKMTQYKLAQETGLYHSTMTDILNCKYQTPNFRNMVLIIRALDISMTEFFDSELFDFEKLEIEEK